MDLLSDPEYFKCDRMSATIKKRYCVDLQDRLAEAVMLRSPNAKHLLEDEIKLSRCRNCPTGWRNRKELEKMDEPKKKCSKCGEEKTLTEFGTKLANKDGHDNYCKACKRAYAKAYARRRALKKKASDRLAWKRKNNKVNEPSAIVPPAIPERTRSFLAEMVSDVVHTAEQANRDCDTKSLIESAYQASLHLSVKLRALMEKVG